MFVGRGDTPSARQILRFIGGGSLSTISDEMANISTRERTREAHAILVARGETPSAGQIMEMLGGGSLAVISEELAKIGPNSSGVRVTTSPPAPSAQPPEGACPPEVARELSSLREILAKLSESTADLHTQMKEMRAEASDQLRVAYERFEAVQRLALQQVDLARQEARDLKTRLATVSLDFETREDAMRGRSQQLRDENQRLLGRIEELTARNKELSNPANDGRRDLADGQDG